MASENKVVNRIIEILDKKKGKDIEVLDLRGLTTLTEYFVIVTGGSDKQVQALCDNVEEELEKEGVFAINKEGYRTAQWILLGYDDVIIHIFKQEARDFYGLDHVWQDASKVDVSDILTD